VTHVEILKKHNLKATPQRLSILNTLEMYGHVTLEEIEKYTKVNFPTLSLSTIYRNINEMIKKNVVSEVKITNSKDYFEINKEKHAHLICKECGKIEDFKIDTQDIVKNIQSLTNDKIIDATLNFEVICKECLSGK